MVRARELGLPFAFILAAALVPLVVQDPYFLGVLVLAGIFVVLAISYGLVVGQLGAFSLVHPAFYGVGAYSLALLETRLHVPFLAALILAAACAGMVGLAVGIPSFRLDGHGFGMATLGILLVIQLVANNWISLTQGPDCVLGVPPASVRLPGGIDLSASGPAGAYYGILVIAVLTYGFARVLIGSRLGRAMRSVRENPTLAATHGVSLTRYRLLGFSVGAALAGAAGAYYATWASLVCPTDISLNYAITLLIIVYLGGARSLWGVMLGAVVFTVIPEALRAAAAARLVIYGILLFFGALYLPEGFAGLVEVGQKRLSSAWRLRTRQSHL